MVEDAKAQAYRGGFVESWLRRCGERPGRSFCQTFVILLVVWFLLGFVGFRRTAQSPLPPSVPGVPYDRYIARHTKGYGIAMEREDVPAFNSNALRGDLRYELRHSQHHSMLTAMQMIGNAQYGWPYVLVTTEASRQWDVTEPVEPFPPLEAEPSRTTFNDQLLLIVRSHSEIGQTRRTRVFWPQILLSMIALQIGALCIVAVGLMAFRLRQRLRLRRGSCWACGHSQVLSLGLKACPECGSSTTRPVAAPVSGWLHRWSGNRPIASMFILWFALGVIVSGISLLHRTPEATDDLDIQAEWYLQVRPNSATVFPTDREFKEPRLVPFVRASIWYGWPLPLVNVIDRQTLAFSWGSSDHTVLQSPQLDSNHWPYFDYEIIWERLVHSDPSTVRRFDLHWQPALLTLFGLHVIAIAMIIFARRIWRA